MHHRRCLPFILIGLLVTVSLSRESLAQDPGSGGCQGECVWDRHATIQGNHTSLTSFPLRITGVRLYDDSPADDAEEGDRCCDLGDQWLRESISQLKAGENRCNVYLHMTCDPGTYPRQYRVNINLGSNPDELKMCASSALRMTYCNISWSGVAELARVTSIQVLFFHQVYFTDIPGDQLKMQHLFHQVRQIHMDRVTPRHSSPVKFINIYRLPLLHTLDIEGPLTDHLHWDNMTHTMPNAQFIRLIDSDMTILPNAQYRNTPTKWTRLESSLNTNRVDFSKLVDPNLYRGYPSLLDWLRKVEFQFSVKKATLLRTLDVRGNRISSFAPLKTGSNIEVLNARRNALSVLDSSVVENLAGLSVLDLGQNHFLSISRDSFRSFVESAGGNRLEMFHVDSANLGDIERIEWSHLRNIKYLDISNNSIANISAMLRKLPSLKMLITSHNNLTQIPYPKEYDTVMYLNVGNNRIDRFPFWIFGSLSLEYIFLDNNHLTTKDLEGVVSKSNFVPSLTSATKRTVILHRNCIRHLPVRTEKAAKTLTEILGQFFLDLTGNPLHCGCADLKAYLGEQGVGNLESIDCDNVSSQPSDVCLELYKREYGENSTDEFYLVDSGQVEPYRCLWEKRRELIIKSTVTSILSVVVLSLLFYALFSNRYDIQLALFYRYGIRLCTGNGPEQLIDNPKYDAFIAYSGKDYKWVIYTLMRTLEQTHGYKCFIHDRDFIPGVDITDNIFEGLKRSKRMIIIISRHFLESEWCAFEFRAAHKEEVMRGTNYVIAIVLEDVIVRHDIPQDLNRYLNTKTYLDINDNWFWRKLVFAMPIRPENVNIEMVTAEDLAARRRGRIQQAGEGRIRDQLGLTEDGGEVEGEEHNGAAVVTEFEIQEDGEMFNLVT